MRIIIEISRILVYSWEIATGPKRAGVESLLVGPRRRFVSTSIPLQLSLSTLIAISVGAFVAVAVVVASVIILMIRYHGRIRSICACSRKRNKVDILEEARIDIDVQGIEEKRLKNTDRSKEIVWRHQERPTPSPVFEFSPPSPHWHPVTSHTVTSSRSPAHSSQNANTTPRDNDINDVQTFGLSFPLPPPEKPQSRVNRITSRQSAATNTKNKDEREKSEAIRKRDRPRSSPPTIMSTDVSYNTIAGLSVSDDTDIDSIGDAERFIKRRGESQGNGNRSLSDLKRRLIPTQTENDLPTNLSRTGLGIAALDSDVSLLASASRTLIAPVIPFAPLLSDSLTTMKSVKTTDSQRSLLSCEYFRVLPI